MLAKNIITKNKVVSIKISNTNNKSKTWEKENIAL